jgi:gas vesicle protein
MGKFMNGMLVGLGAGLLFAPMTGEEMRRLISERWQDLQHSLSSNGLRIPSDQPTILPRSEQHTPSEQSISSTGSQITDVEQQAELNAMKTTSPNIEEGMPRRPSPSARREGRGRLPLP